MPASSSNPGTDLETDLETDLATERAHLADSRAALRRMREHVKALYATGANAVADEVAAETLDRMLTDRIAELADDPDTPLFFGRLTLAEGERHHIGRRHVTDVAGEPMVLDWRAPLSRAFYQASVADPHGVSVRRRFGFARGELTSFEDEHLDRGEELGTASRILTDEIERPRVGPMRDIVATIQPEQDDLVRADLDASICVQGAPGTGKTAVGLHRAAYLLYLHRERLRRSGVLVVGPNRAFLRYIGAVLPALGEVDVHQSTVDELLPVPITGKDTEAAAALKHDARMAAVLTRALWGYIRKPEHLLVVSDGSYRWRLSPDALRRVVDGVRREAPPYAVGRERVRARVVALLQRQAEAKRGDSPGEPWLRRMGRSKPVTEFLDAAWPAMTADRLVWSLLSDAGRLAGAAAGILDADERAAIVWPRPPRAPRSVRWSAAEAVLVDEAAGLIERLPSYGHVVVDEAQDLSPMQCRAIARRSEHGSITLLGDLAQATAPWATRDWRECLAHLGKPDAAVVPLTVGFRVPAPVLALANRLLPALRVQVPPARSLRRDGVLAIHPVPAASGTAGMAAASVAAVRAALAYEGSVGVIAADDVAPGLAAALAAAGIHTVPADDADADADPVEPARVSVLPATLAKGLEYDHVIVVEPAQIVAAEPRGLNRLFVVLTRAVSRLDVLHAQPLPAPIRPADPADQRTADPAG